MADPQRTARPAAALPKEDALRRLARLKKATTIASVLGFGAVTALIAGQSTTGTTTTGATMLRPRSASPLATATTAAVPATATPTAAATATPSPVPTRTSARKSVVQATATPRATATSLDTATATPAPTATPMPTATAVPTATPQNSFFNQGQGGPGVGGPNTNQPPVAGSGNS